MSDDKNLNLNKVPDPKETPAFSGPVESVSQNVVNDLAEERRRRDAMALGELDRIRKVAEEKAKEAEEALEALSLAKAEYAYLRTRLFFNALKGAVIGGALAGLWVVWRRRS